jgi:hypothetical protein
MGRSPVDSGRRWLARLAERLFTSFDHAAPRPGGTRLRPVVFVTITVVAVAAAVVTAVQTVRWVHDASSHYTHAVVEESRRVIPYQTHMLRVSYVDASGVAHGVSRPVTLEVPPWVSGHEGTDPVVIEQGHTVPVRVDRSDGTVVEAALHPPPTIWHTAGLWLALLVATIIAVAVTVFRIHWRENTDTVALGQEFHGWTGDQRTLAPR